jgi:hypothetical protein
MSRAKPDTIREELIEMERVFSRRSFFFNVAKGVGVAAAYDKFGPSLFAQTSFTPDDVVSSFGNVIIPVDQDPGWKTFDPGITNYTLRTYLLQVYSNGNQVAFSGLLAAITAFNTLPVTIGYGPTFLNMTVEAQGTYFANILTGIFENNGVQDILLFAGVYMMLAIKQVFYLNYPNHLPTPGAEFQVVPTTGIRTGWLQMQFAGPVQAAEETALRARNINNVEVVGIDLRNPYI